MANRNQRPTPPNIPASAVSGAIICKSFELPVYAPDSIRQPGNRARAAVGRHIPSDILLRMKNRRALEDSGYIKLTAMAPGAGVDSSSQLASALARLAELEKEKAQGSFGAASGDRYAVHTGMGRYDVIEGRKLNAEPMTKEAAAELCKAKA